MGTTAVAKKKTQKATRATKAAKKPATKVKKKTTKKKVATKKKTAAASKLKKPKTAKKKAAAKRTTSKKKTTAKKKAAKTTRKTAKRAPAKPARAAKPASPPRPRKRAAPRLNAQDLELFRELLLQKRAELVGDMSTLENEALSDSRRDAAGDLSSMPIHMADLGTDNYEKEFTLGLIEGERALLREIDEALERIDKGTYGICQATERPIGKARLRAQPWAKYCYEYVLAQEKGQPNAGY